MSALDLISSVFRFDRLMHVSTAHMKKRAEWHFNANMHTGKNKWPILKHLDRRCIRCNFFPIPAIHLAVCRNWVCNLEIPRFFSLDSFIYLYSFCRVHIKIGAHITLNRLKLYFVRQSLSEIHIINSPRQYITSVCVYDTVSNVTKIDLHNEFSDVLHHFLEFMCIYYGCGFLTLALSLCVCVLISISLDLSYFSTWLIDHNAHFCFAHLPDAVCVCASECTPSLCHFYCIDEFGRTQNLWIIENYLLKMLLNFVEFFFGAFLFPFQWKRAPVERHRIQYVNCIDALHCSNKIWLIWSIRFALAKEYLARDKT